MPLPLLALAGISAGASLAGGIANAIANMSAAERAAAIQEKSFQEWLKLNIPDPKQQELVLDKFVQQGELAPQLEQAIAQEPSAFEGIMTSASQKSAQKRALSELERIGYEGGLTLQDKADLQSATLESQNQERANRMAIEADMARRGMGNSGFAVAAQLGAQQAGADRNAQSSLNVAAQARSRALEAIMGAGNMATQQRSQDFGEQAQKAAAKDAINRFNTQNLQDVQMRNIGAQNQAAAQNLRERQRIADSNTTLGNEQQQYNKELLQKDYENRLRKTQGMTGQQDKQAQLEQRKGEMLGNVFTNTAQGISGAATAYGDYEYKRKK